MKNLLQKIKSLRKPKPIGSISYAKDTIHPLRDWSILLYTTIIILILLAIFAFYFYTAISQGKLFTAIKQKDTSGVSINSNLMQRTISAIDARAASSTELSQNKITVPDPSR